jgi:plastocyanin
MLLRPGATVAVLAVTWTVAADALAADQTITARSSPNRWEPANVTIDVGDTVTFTNASGTHNVNFADGLFEMPLNAVDARWTHARTFSADGSFDYICEEHPLSMSGTVTVRPAPTPGPPPGDPPPGNPPPDPAPGDSPPPLTRVRVILKLSDATPLAGRRVRLFGVVRPARDGAKVRIQKRGRGGRYRTVATTRLRDAGAARSVFSLRLTVARDAVLRARVAGDDLHATGLSKAKRVDVHP